MSNTFSYLLGASYGGVSPLANVASAMKCTYNGQVVDCPEWIGSFFLAFGLFLLVALVLTIAGMWKIFQKAGKPGWASIVPIYNAVVLLEITRKPLWWILLYLLPVVNVVVSVLVMHELSKAFGKGIGYTIGLIALPVIFYPMLGFGKAVYSPPADGATAAI